MRPRIDESAPNRALQVALEITATRDAVPSRVSSSVNSRPIRARAPRMRNVLAVMKAPTTRSGLSVPVRLTLCTRWTPMSSKS